MDRYPRQLPGTMVDRIVPAATEASLAEITDALGVEDPCAISCEPFIQWVIEDNFVAAVLSGKWRVSRWCRMFCRGSR